MKVTLLGTGCPLPDLKRYGPAAVIETATAGTWLVDCGEGALLQSMRAGFPAAGITRLIFTHLHLDHMVGYPQFIFGGWHMGRRELKVWAPKGLKRFTDFLIHDYFQEDIAYRVGLGFSPAGLKDIEINEFGPGLVHQEGELTIEALPVLHSIPTFALRFREGAQMVVHSGDTRYCEELIDFARGADVLIHDCQLVPHLREMLTKIETPTIWERLHRTHCTPAECGRIARLAGVKKLVLVHLPPETDPARVEAECATEFAGEIFVGKDLLKISTGSTARRRQSSPMAAQGGSTR